MDLVVAACQPQPVGRDELVVHARQHAGPVVEQPDVKRLYAAALRHRLQAEGVEPRWAPPGRYLRDGRAERILVEPVYEV